MNKNKTGPSQEPCQSPIELSTSRIILTNFHIDQRVVVKANHDIGEMIRRIEATEYCKQGFPLYQINIQAATPPPPARGAMRRRTKLLSNEVLLLSYMSHSSICYLLFIFRFRSFAQFPTYSLLACSRGHSQCSHFPVPTRQRFIKTPSEVHGTERNQGFFLS